MLALYALFAVFGVALVVHGGVAGNAFGVASLVLGLIYWVYWFLVRPRRLRSYATRVLTQMSVRDQIVCWELSSEQLACTEPTGTTTLKWMAIYEAVETPAGLMLYPNEAMFHWIPSYAFDQSTWHSVVQLTKDRVERFSRCGF